MKFAEPSFLIKSPHVSKEKNRAENFGGKVLSMLGRVKDNPL